ncbi:Coenzyme F420 hydrogenase/dehydrogenase, beta subunit C-terminal domain [Lacrimispora saccharolytica]|nr:Coenzyme F420 hydrogenase/dehydrogenase, beta subunit C-terminal domain [Lacrimispora saccharolytica]
MSRAKGNLKYIESYCSGCGLCHSIYGYELLDDKKGFPTICQSKDDEKLKKICPVFYYEEEVKHDIWGTVQKALVGYSSNKNIRYKAASGGALTELCIYLLESNKVDGIIHTTFDSKDPTRTISCVSYTAEEIISRCGSRYSISVPLYNLNSLMKDGEKYAFVGKPCDVMALRRGIEVNSKLGKQIPYLLSFFCAGEPSVDAQNNLIKAIGTTKEKFSTITYRGNGWPGYTTVTEKDGNVLKMEYKNAWGKYLGRDIRNLCRFCMDGTGDAADIVCADFWYLDKDGAPDFSEHEGRNIIIARTEKGSEILDETVGKGRLMIEDDFTRKIDTEFHLYQPAQYKRKGTMESMIWAMKLCKKQAPKYSKSYLKKYASHIDRKVKNKFFIGTLKRILRGKI